jgi:hypothetical protein
MLLPSVEQNGLAADVLALGSRINSKGVDILVDRTPLTVALTDSTVVSLRVPNAGEIELAPRRYGRR